jgi:hypothetical protein
MDVSNNATYYIKEKLKIKVAKWGNTTTTTTKKKKKKNLFSIGGRNQETMVAKVTLTRVK